MKVNVVVKIFKLEPVEKKIHESETETEVYAIVHHLFFWLFVFFFVVDALYTSQVALFAASRNRVVFCSCGTILQTSS